MPERSRTAAFVSVGGELLRGEVVDANAAEVSEALVAAGFTLAGGWTSPDEDAPLRAALRTAAAVAGVVVVTGGLGPTPDDLTREALASVAAAPLRRDEAVADELRRRFTDAGRRVTDGVLRQADVPQGATVLPNRRGTAPGLRVAAAGATFFALPGVPSEMRTMLAEQVLPELGADGADRPVTVVLRTSGIGESDVAEALRETFVPEPDGGPHVAYLAADGEVRVRLTCTGPDGSTRLDAAADAARAALGDAVYGEGDDTLAATVLGLLRGRGDTLGVAESLTGGAVTAALTAVPGASDVLRGGLVVYATDLKASLGRVPDEVLAQHGAVSEPTARALAEGVRRALGATCGLALTGVAGPASQEGQPPGTVHVAAALPGGTHTRALTLPGDRERVRTLARVAALDLLRRALATAARG